jgi:hypothetical protein
VRRVEDVMVLRRGRYARAGSLRQRMYMELNTTPEENLDVLDRLIQVGGGQHNHAF